MRNVRALFACATIAAARAEPASSAELVRYHTKRSRMTSKGARMWQKTAKRYEAMVHKTE